MSLLDDTMRSWPKGKYVLAGLRYRPAVNGSDEISVDQRIYWLRNTKDYFGTAYQELVQAYRDDGSESSAEMIFIAGQRDMRRRGNLRRSSRAWNRFLDLSVGYGYRLHRAFLTILILWVVSSVLYYQGEQAHVIFATGRAGVAAPACPVGYPCFNPFVHSLQLLIPVINLGEASAWLPNANIKPWGTFLVAYTWLMITIGWVLGVALVPGLRIYFRRR